MKHAFLLSFLLSTVCSADVRLPALISDHMMLQRDVSPRIWGLADPSEPVRVTFAGSTLNTVAGPAGRWQVFLKPSPMQTAGSDLVIAGKNTLTVHDVDCGGRLGCVRAVEYGIPHVSN